MEKRRAFRTKDAKTNHQTHRAGREETTWKHMNQLEETNHGEKQSSSWLCISFIPFDHCSETATAEQAANSHDRLYGSDQLAEM